MKSFFIAGVMQGSRHDKGIHSQDYRQKIKPLIEKHFPGARIICPFAENPNSVEYDDLDGRQTFLQVIEQAAGVDVLIAYLPEASMGTALEMWEASRRGATIWTISPLKSNWVVKFLSQRIFASIQELETYLEQMSKGASD
jgi:hypothetical protein